MRSIALSVRLHSALLRHRPAELPRGIWPTSTCPSSSIKPLVARSMSSAGSADAKVAQKAEMRKQIKAALKQTSQEDMATQSAAIAAHVLAAPFFAKSKAAAVYLTAPRLREVDTSHIVAAMLQSDGSSKRCYVPVVVDQSSNMSFLHIDSMESLVEMPPFGIMEPTQHHADGSPRENVLEHEEPLDIILMPGLGFDRTGGRLGRGGGYYDKFLGDMMKRASSKGWDPPLLVALAFRQQVVNEVPMTEMDQPIDFLVTPEGIHACRDA